MVTAYTSKNVYVMFQGDKHEAVYDSRWHRHLMGWLASLTMEDEVRHDMGLP